MMAGATVDWLVEQFWHDCADVPDLDTSRHAVRRAIEFAIAIEAQRAVTVKQGAVRSTKARVRRTSPNSTPMNTPTHEGDVE
jgi:hypothetical protein